MGNDKYGIHAMGADNLNLSQYNRYKSGFTGWRSRKPHSGFETARNVFDNDFWIDDITFFASDGKYYHIGSMPGPLPNTPDYEFSPPDSVPLITTDRGQYAHMTNANYLARLKNHWSKIVDIVKSLDPSIQQFVLTLQSAESSTGDQGTIKGNITKVTINGVTQNNPTSYNIPDQTWTELKRADLWPFIGNLVNDNLPTVKVYMNISNDGENFRWMVANIPGVWMKLGYPTHNYSISGEKFQKQMCDEMKYSAVDEHRFMGELDQTFNLSWWTQSSPKQNLRTLLVSACVHGIDIINIALQTMQTTFGTDLTLMNWCKKYYGYRLPSETKSGFIVFRRIIDIADETTYPVGTYGPVINPSTLSSYNQSVNRINNNSFYSDIQKLWKITQIKIDNLNPARVTALRNAFPDAPYLLPSQDQDHNAYGQGFGVDTIPGNFEKFGHVVNENAIKYYWNQGPVNDYYCKFGAGFDAARPRINCYEEQTQNGLNYQISFTVTYLDRGTGTWSFRYHNGSTEATAKVVSCGNSGSIKTVIINIPNYDGGRKLAGGAGFALQHDSGDYNVVFDSVEWEVTAVNNPSNNPPTAEAGSNQTVTETASTFVSLSGTGTDEDGSIVAYRWSKLSGPAGGTFSDATNQNTLFSGLTAGEYILQLEVTDDDGDKGTDTVIITVNPGLPIANAGSNQTITQPTSGVTLSAAASVPTSGTSLTYAWTQISGPSCTIATPSNVTTNVTGMSTPGTYIFQVVVTNSYGLSDSSAVTVVVQAAPPPNQPPVANAGIDQTLTGATTISLTGSGTDTDGTVVAYAWTKISGTGGTITSPTTASADVTGLSTGTYVFQLEVTDNNGAKGTDTVTIIINAASNLEPIPNAGINQTIQLPTDSVTLDGTGSTDPDGTITAQLWTLKSGPNTPSIVSPSSLITVVNGLIAGTYVFRLRVQDNTGNIKGDSVTITVLPPNTPPVVSINTPDATLQLPDDSISVTASASDADGSISSLAWTQIEGDAATISSPTTANTTFSDLQPGINVFRLTATDNSGAQTYKDFTVTVNDPEVEEDYLLNVEIADLTSYQLTDGIEALKTLPFRVNQSEVLDAKSNVTISLQYIDNGNETFYVNCIRCTQRARRVLQVRKRNTGNVVSVAITVKDFKFGGKLDFDADFNISGAEGTVFKFVGFVNNDIRRELGG